MHKSNADLTPCQTPLLRRQDASGAWVDPLIGPEHVHDMELGGAWNSRTASLELNLYRMEFQNELIPYEFNADVNTWVTTNAARSVHQGIEATGSTWFRLPGEARLTQRVLQIDGA